jgi:hypothetical protein
MGKIKCLILFLTLICSFYQNLNAQNIVLNKSYTFSPAANYSLTSKDTEYKLLTDGNSTNANGFFWTSHTTVGWQDAKRISIQIDLDKEFLIDKVTFNTARAVSSGVQFPSHVLVFTSRDKKKYSYAGDITNDLNNVPGPYEIRKFTLSGINQSSRYVQLIIIPNGHFVFCDEIEVFAGSALSPSKSKNHVFAAGIDHAADTILKIINQTELLKSFNSKYFKTAIIEHQNVNTTGDLINKLNKTRHARIKFLQGKFKNTFIVDKVNPWEKITSVYIPRGDSNFSYSFLTTVNGVQYGAFIITNLSDANQGFDFSVINNRSDVALLKLYTVPFVTANNYEEIADPLIPVNKGVKISAGESRMFLFKISGEKSGKAMSTIGIHSTSFTIRLVINSDILNIGLANKTYTLNAINWAYLYTALLNDRKDEAISDLLNHHINTMVVPPYALPVIGSLDFKVYRDYIAKLKSFNNIILFMNFNSASYTESFKRTPFMSAEWKANFIKWFDGIMENSKAAAFSPSQLYLYPFDEIGDKDIPDFREFLNWLKMTYPDVQTFATFTIASTEKQLMPLLTISQVVNREDLIGMKPVNGNKLWIYDTQPNSQMLSSYTYYRLMAWQAFYYELNGIGFWNYADYENGTASKPLWDKFNGANGTDYSVIYNGPGQEIISSKRWEAFSLGIEDYELLNRYSKKYGLAKAKSLAGIVIHNSGDIVKADIIRNQILESLK